jgi:mono/diheme cytochrome c family protein
MKSKVFSGLVLASLFTFFNCSGPVKQSDNVEIKPAKSELSEKELVARGKYLTTIAGCNDCHSPKVMTPQGPGPDTTRLLSGHPQNEKLATVINTQDWILFNNSLTAFVGPWGVSYAANLTPDETGIGNWKFEQFLTAIRKGKSKGLEGSRPLLPPMPWQMYRTMTDEDLKAVFTYLKSLPAVSNRVPDPIAPNHLISQSK